MRYLLSLLLVFFLASPVWAEDVFSDFLNASQTRFSAADVRSFVAKYPQYMNNDMAMAFGIQTAKYGMNPDEIRNALPQDVHEGFDRGYSLVVKKNPQ